MSVCGHSKKPCVNDAAMAGSVKVFVHIHLLLHHSANICPSKLCTVAVTAIVSACLASCSLCNID